METKLTAVEWLIDQVEQFHCLLPVDMIEQAKAMEKEQIVQAFKHKRLPVLHRSSKAENYYNETYGK